MTSGSGRVSAKIVTLSLLSLLALVIGCGGSVSVVPVSGKITLNGQPAEKLAISLSPQGGGIGASGITDAQGQYVLKTVEEPPREGAAPGKYYVKFAIFTEQAENDDSVGKVTKVLKPEFTDGTMTFEVPTAGSTSANFDLTTR